MHTNKTCQAHKCTYGSLTKTNEKKCSQAHWQFKRFRYLKMLVKSTVWMECLKLVNVLKSTFLDREFLVHTFSMRSLKNAARTLDAHIVFYTTYRPTYLWPRSENRILSSKMFMLLPMKGVECRSTRCLPSAWSWQCTKSVGYIFSCDG